MVDFLSEPGLTFPDMSQIDAQVRNVKLVQRGPLGIVLTGQLQEPTGMRSAGDLDRHTKKVAEHINRRREELGLTQETLARKAGVSVGALRSKLLYRTGAAPDYSMLGNVSVALGWDARYLPGLWSGEYDFDADPLELDAAPAPERKPWRTPAVTPGTREAALEKTVRVQGAKLRILESQLAELSARLDEFTGAPQRRAV